ncbi:TIGR02270 family protein [Archangium violaceum]|uniref:TIGR02270 family protein n=1 Tax=Archangium violaceum TaxID=83451 RepID=UPI00193C27A7|nr:TIGR02270 family protein [Archangium violaceum]QRK12590.1 TIGR02270 family protein [Archangium violaceum]
MEALSDELFLNWEVYEEHLEEAEFLWGQRERQGGSPEYRLPEVAEGEERLLARVDALVLGGTPVAEGLLVPALESELPTRTSAAAYTLLVGGVPGASQAVLEAVRKEVPGVLEAMAKALALLEPGALPAWVPQLLEAPEPALQALALGVLGTHGGVPTARLLALLQHEEEEVVAAALRALARSRTAVDGRTLQHLLASPVPAVRDAAIEAGLAGGQRAAWAACQATLAVPDAHLSRLLWALGGDDRDVQRLVALLDTPALRADVLWVLGFSGRLAAADACMVCLADPSVTALAGEAFSALTGLRLKGPYALERSEPSEAELDTNPDMDIRRSMEDLLPLPAPDAVAAWWKEARPRFTPGQRYLLGEPLTAGSLLEALETAPMRRRHVLGLEVTLRSQGQVRVPTRAWARTQEAALRAARALPPAHFARPFTEGLSS